MNKLKFALGFTSLFILPVLVLAAGVSGFNNATNIPSAEPIKDFNVQTVINNILKYAFGILIALAAIFILYAAFVYLTASGDTEKIEKAHNLIIYAIVAIVVGAVAKGLVAVVTNILGVTK